MTKYWLGKHRSKKDRMKISATLKGRKQPPRSKEYCKNISKTKIASQNGMWKGYRKIDQYGYIMTYAPNHPYTHNSRYQEHRLVVEKYLGRFLLPSEEVHHINKIKHDNRIENLMVFTKWGYHMAFERGFKVNEEGITFDGRKYKKEALCGP